jgi:heat-inducible transcriptional repressor
LELSERKQRILSAIVELYNRTGEPVGSKRLQELLPDGISSATIRNEMAQLTDMGYLEQPHTSAGRVPSHVGYRFYIDRLLPGKELPPEQRQQLEAMLHLRAREPEKLLESAGQLLAELTSCAALCVAPGGAQARIRRIDMAPMGRRMAMVALLTSHGVVKSKILRVDEDMTQETREVFYRLAQEELIDRPLEQLTPGAVQSLAVKAGAQWLQMASLLAAASELAQEVGSAEVLVGEENLYHNLQLEGQTAPLAQALHGLYGLRALAEAPDGVGVRVILGSEAPLPHPALLQTSMILSPYAIGETQGGLLGIIGPIRQDYDRWIPSIRCMASLVERLLRQLTIDE